MPGLGGFVLVLALVAVGCEVTAPATAPPPPPRHSGALSLGSGGTVLGSFLRNHAVISSNAGDPEDAEDINNNTPVEAKAAHAQHQPSTHDSKKSVASLMRGTQGGQQKQPRVVSRSIGGAPTHMVPKPMPKLVVKRNRQELRVSANKDDNKDKGKDQGIPWPQSSSNDDNKDSNQDKEKPKDASDESKSDNRENGSNNNNKINNDNGSGSGDSKTSTPQVIHHNTTHHQQNHTVQRPPQSRPSNTTANQEQTIQDLEARIAELDRELDRKLVEAEHAKRHNTTHHNSNYDHGFEVGYQVGFRQAFNAATSDYKQMYSFPQGTGHVIKSGGGLLSGVSGPSPDETEISPATMSEDEMEAAMHMLMQNSATITSSPFGTSDESFPVPSLETEPLQMPPAL